MSKHTPGPWKANFAIDGAAYIFAADRNFARVFDEWDSEDNRDANARLIAAAPELLEALQLAMPALQMLATEEARSNKGKRTLGMEPKFAHTQRYEKCRAAIAKAESK